MRFDLLGPAEILLIIEELELLDDLFHNDAWIFEILNERG